jgi:transcriptional regulator with XRE-family HTH domain
MQQLCNRVKMPNGKNLTVPGLSRIENNKSFTRAALEAIANALDRPLTDLLTPLHLLALPPDVRQLASLPKGVREPIETMIRYAVDAEAKKTAADADIKKAGNGDTP